MGKTTATATAADPATDPAPAEASLEQVMEISADALAQEAATRQASQAALDAALTPRIGQDVRYQVRAGVVIPMMVTRAHSADLVDGVIFSGDPADVSSASGTRAVQRVQRGRGDGQWHEGNEAWF